MLDPVHWDGCARTQIVVIQDGTGPSSEPFREHILIRTVARTLSPFTRTLNRSEMPSEPFRPRTGTSAQRTGHTMQHCVQYCMTHDAKELCHGTAALLKFDQTHHWKEQTKLMHPFSESPAKVL